MRTFFQGWVKSLNLQRLIKGCIRESIDSGTWPENQRLWTQDTSFTIVFNLRSFCVQSSRAVPPSSRAWDCVLKTKYGYRLLLSSFARHSVSIQKIKYGYRLLLVVLFDIQFPFNCLTFYCSWDERLVQPNPKDCCT